MSITTCDAFIGTVVFRGNLVELVALVILEVVLSVDVVSVIVLVMLVVDIDVELVLLTVVRVDNVELEGIGVDVGG